MNNKNDKRIERYLSSKMEAEEKMQFELDLKSNVGLREDYELHLASEEVLEVLAFRKEFDEIKSRREPMAGTAKLPKKSYRWLVRLAAALIPLLMLFAYADLKYSDEALFASNYEVPDFSSFKGGDESMTKMIQAGEYYRDEEFEKSRSILERLLDANPQNIEVKFALGSVYNEMSDLKKATEIFESLTLNENSKKDRAELYVTLMKIKQGQLVEAQVLLDRIGKNENHYFHKEALKLSSNLNSNWRKLVFL